MYQIGDKILYPTHGAGVIEEIEERTVLGKKHEYYILRLQPEGMKVMIPKDGCDDIGVRYIISCEEGAKVLERFRDEPIDLDENWNRRQRDNMERLKSGDIYRVLTVVKNLMFRDRQKGLSTSERKMLATAKRILVSEIVLCGAAGLSDAESILSDTIEELM